jgi:hypothetical protein
MSGAFPSEWASCSHIADIVLHIRSRRWRSTLALMGLRTLCGPRPPPSGETARSRGSRNSDIDTKKRQGRLGDASRFGRIGSHARRAEYEFASGLPFRRRELPPRFFGVAAAPFPRRQACAVPSLAADRTAAPSSVWRLWARRLWRRGETGVGSARQAVEFGKRPMPLARALVRLCGRAVGVACNVAGPR